MAKRRIAFGLGPALAAAFSLTPALAAPVLTAEQARAVAVRESYATTPDGVRIYYRVAGEGDEVVLAPFALFHGTTLDRLAKGRRIVTYDPRGRGKSQTVTPEMVSLDLLLTDLEAVRRALGKERVALIGWSGGGMEMFVYALRNPGRVSRLVQLAPVGPRLSPYGDQMGADREKRTDAAAKAAYDARVASGAFKDDPAAECRARAEVTRPALFFDRSKAAMAPDVCVHPNEHSATIGAYFRGLFTSIRGYDWVSALPTAQVPRLVIHPLQDNIPLAGSEEWVRGQSSARLVTIDRSGHFPLYEQPEATLSAIAAFLDGKWPDGARAVPAN